MRIDRRRALALMGMGAATPAAAAIPPVAAGDARFHHGVASGDPLATRLVIWTRVSTSAQGPVPVRWEVSEDEAFTRLAATGALRATAVRDHTVKVDVGGLKPGRAYFYRFVAGNRTGGATSPVGRARTLPVGPTKDVVFAVASCALYPGGYFNAYQAIADLARVDAVIHLGDYIYEYAPEEYGDETGKLLNRLPDPPHECLTLEDYRRRLACHRADPQLQAAHARAAWIVTWDDHETADNSWTGGAENHNPDKGDGDWNARKAAAIRAWYEWMPIREPAQGRSGFAAWRSFSFGDLASVMMIETRLTARTHQMSYAELEGATGETQVAAFRARLADPARRMMGPPQHAWLAQALAASKASGQTWQVIGNQVVMARVLAPDILAEMSPSERADFEKALGANAVRRTQRMTRLSAAGLPYNLDAWDGYPADRDRLYAEFTQAGAHPIVLSGDSHVFWVNELWDAESNGARVAAELGTTGITSPGAGDYFGDFPLGKAFADRNREVIHSDQKAKGFVLLTLSRDSAKAELVTVSSIVEKAYRTETRKRFEISPARGGGVEAIREV